MGVQEWGLIHLRLQHGLMLSVSRCQYALTRINYYTQLLNPCIWQAISLLSLINQVITATKHNLCQTVDSCTCAPFALIHEQNTPSNQSIFTSVFRARLGPLDDITCPTTLLTVYHRAISTNTESCAPPNHRHNSQLCNIYRALVKYSRIYAFHLICIYFRA